MSFSHPDLPQRSVAIQDLIGLPSHFSLRPAKQPGVGTGHILVLHNKPKTHTLGNVRFPHSPWDSLKKTGFVGMPWQKYQQ